mgnify:CR=1 FL=1
MRVADGVDLQRADVRRQEDQVLQEGGEHAPGVEIHKGHDEAGANGRYCGHDDVNKDVIAQHQVWIVLKTELADDDVDASENGPRHDDGVDDHGRDVHLFGALGSIAQGGRIACR